MKIKPGNQFCIPTNWNLRRLIHNNFFKYKCLVKKNAANENHIRVEKIIS